MATPKDENDRKRGEEKAKRIGEVVAKHRAALNAEIKKIDPNLIVELAAAPAIDKIVDPTAFFSDWPDTWNDHGTWVKTWGKGGDEVMLPLEELRERILAARLRQDLER